jgi:hypothetical protein
MSLFSSSSIKINIELAEHAIIMRDEDDASYPVLRGAVVIEVSSATRIRTAHVHLYGHLNINLKGVASQDIANKHQVIIHDSRTLVPETETFHTLAPGTYRYPFEKVLPRHLPETIHTKHANIEYYLRAIIERPGLYPNCTVKREVLIERRQEADVNWFEPCYVQDTWQRRVKYVFCMSRRAYGWGEQVPIQLDWRPMQSNSRVLNVVCQLERYTRYIVNGEEAYREKTKVARQVYSLIDKELEFTFKLPENKPHLDRRRQHDCDTAWVEVRHRLRTYVIFQDAKGMGKILCDLPIIVLPHPTDVMLESPPPYAESSSSILLMQSTAPPSPRSIRDTFEVDSPPSLTRVHSMDMIVPNQHGSMYEAEQMQKPRAASVPLPASPLLATRAYATWEMTLDAPPRYETIQASR